VPGSILTPSASPPSAITSPPPAGWAVHLGEAALLGTAASVVASIPAAVRTSAVTGSFVLGLLAVSAAVVPPFVVCVAVGRAARRAWRELTDGSGASIAAGIAAWVAIVLPLYVVLGTVLKATTHHRALGGMTFGVLALVLALGAALTAWRLVTFAEDLVARRPTRRVAVLSVALLLFAFALATPVSRAILASGLGLGALTPGARAAFVDGAMAFVALPLAVAGDLGPSVRRRLAAAGPLAAALVVGLGALALSRGEPLRAALAARAALAGPLAAMVGLGGPGGPEPQAPAEPPPPF
jgi:hypothetical protein